MLSEIDHPARTRPTVALPPELLARAAYDSRGIFEAGRDAELEALRRMGARDPSLGRLYEGHFNALLLVALYGTSEQRARASLDAKAGRLFGVWNTEADEPVTLVPRGPRFRLSGAKTWASGADSVARALITVRLPEGGTQLCLIPMDQAPAVVDDSSWLPLGMEASKSFRVCFDGVDVETGDLIGGVDDYEREPWFLGGALRFTAVHTGIVERLATETYAFLVDTGRHDDALHRARAGELRIAAQSSCNWLDAGAAAWKAFDRDPCDETCGTVVAMADMARLAVERAALDALELSIRAVGARGLVEPWPFAALVRDLTMYLRQPAPDSALSRVGIGALRSASARRSAESAHSTGSSG